MDSDTPGINAGIRWLLQAISGIMLVILLCVHLIVNHLVAPQGLLTYADIVRYYDLPGIALMEAGFLITVTSHCLLGLHSIVLDLNPPAFVRRLTTQFLVILGVGMIFYGIYLIIKIV
jgi:succinate dehydrogenase / fumarate reductase, membrane anchor subunit